MENKQSILTLERTGKEIPVAQKIELSDWQVANGQMEKLTKISRPEPVNKEVSWDKSKVMVSKSDPFGLIEYANDVLIEVSGYEEYELIGMPHNILRHPDMPKVIFKLLWDNLKSGNTTTLALKNQAKSGRYFWVLADFDSKKNAKGETANYYARYRSMTAEMAEKIELLYDKLLQIEIASGPIASEKYLVGFLEEKGRSYGEHIHHLEKQTTPAPLSVTPDPQPSVESKKGIFTKLFGK